jgi:hypothetical protein
MEQHGLGLAHLGRDLAVAIALPGLLQAIHLAGQLSDHILDAGEVGFRGLQRNSASWRRAQPSDAGNVLQHPAALFGLAE